MGYISKNVGVTGHSIKQFEFFSTGLQLTHFGQTQLDLDGADGYIHGPCTTPCISTNTAWNLAKMLLGIIIINYVNQEVHWVF